MKILTKLNKNRIAALFRNRLVEKGAASVAVVFVVSISFNCSMGCGSENKTPEDTDIYVEAVSDSEMGSGTQADPFRKLQVAIDAAADGSTIRIGPGIHTAEARESIDPTCGNCADSEFYQQIPITIGFHISGKSLHFIGASAAETTLVTSAGYGMFFENAGISSVDSLTVTGGKRDGDGRATDAGIIAKYTELTITHVLVSSDALFDGEPDPVVGIIGIAGREGAKLSISDSRIINNSWDGIALYRGEPNKPETAPSATILRNEIGCTKVREECVGRSGRGVGIGVTWDATATIQHNWVHNYWKGVGSFGTTQVTLQNNIVELQHGWGVVVSGNSTMDVINNVIARNGTTGLAGWNQGAGGKFINNLIVGNGWNTSEWVGKRTGIWLNAQNSFQVTHNVLWGNLSEQICSGGIPGETPCTPLPVDEEQGNRLIDPQTTWRDQYRVEGDSPLKDSGDPEIIDADGTRSDIGAYGGPGGDWTASLISG